MFHRLSPLGQPKVSKNGRVWVVDDDRSIRWVLERALQQAGIQVELFDSAEPLLRRLETESPHAVVTDVRMPGTDGFELLDILKSRQPDVPVIVMTAHSDLDSAVQSYQGGAFEYLPKPFDVEEAIEVVRRAVAHAQETIAAKPPAVQQDEEVPEIIGQAPAMQEVFRAIGRLAHSHITVLINGESGTGKELVARALHRHSPRGKGPFVAINMAAIPHELIESELFGHEKGAFTGATQQRTGRFEQADGGTLFLDEIGDMPPDTQTRLLRVLADGEFYRVGGASATRVDVRIIAATHQNLEARVEAGSFREDLFHRLNVIRVHLPRLAERHADIPLLARHFMKQAARELGGEPKLLRPETEAFLSGLEWPGNVRMLENTCRWLTVMAPGREVHVEDLPPELLGQSSSDMEADWGEVLRAWADRQLIDRPADAPALLEIAMPRFETIMITTALRHTGGRRRDAAHLLGWGRNTLTRKIRDLGLEDVSEGDDSE